jgi:hypothetical protein
LSLIRILLSITNPNLFILKMLFSVIEILNSIMNEK